MATIKLVSLGSGREVEVPEGTTVGQVREIAGISDDLELRFNGSAVTEGNSGQVVSEGDTVSAAAPSIKHGIEAAEVKEAEEATADTASDEDEDGDENGDEGKEPDAE